MSEHPKLVAFDKQFAQDADTCDPEGPLQFLNIKQDDGGGGPFWTLQTSRWAISCIAEMTELLRSAGVPETEPEP